MHHYIPRSGSSTPIPMVRHRHLLLSTHSTGAVQVVLGGGSSELVGGSLLGTLLQPAADYLQQQVQQLQLGQPAPPTAVHTSLGVPEALPAFVAALAPHLPASWHAAQWGVLLQAEGTSAVSAAVHALQQRTRRPRVGVAAASYHGPPATAYGSRGSSTAKPQQLCYPAPASKQRHPDETQAAFWQRIEAEQETWLTQHPEVGVILVEPQWGSAAHGQPWPRELLRRFVASARARGVLVCADEIMCGLGRHGQGRTFLVDAWGIEVDAIVFGKAVAAGTFPLAGALLRTWTPMADVHTHTYAHGAHPLALLTATRVLQQLPGWHAQIAAAGALMAAELAGTGATGQGLLWGVRHPQPSALQQACQKAGLQVYAIPDGILLTPLLNAELPALQAALRALVAVLVQPLPPAQVVPSESR